MPVPEGQITTSQIWNGQPEKKEPRELTEDERLEIAKKISKGEL